LKAVVLGSGHIGSVIAKDFASGLPSWEVVVADREESRAERAASGYAGDNLSPAAIGAGGKEAFVQVIRGSDLVIGALPGSAGFAAAEACVAAAVNLVDVSFYPEDPFQLDRPAAAAGVVMIPDCGVAPGLSNILVGAAVSRLDSVESVHVMVGGLPVKPFPPLNYVVTWSVEGLIDEYTRKARIVKDGRLVEVEALTGVEEVDFPGVGRLQAFYTDGARTLFRTIQGVREMWEKTLRYPGHVQGIEVLKGLGFLEDGKVEVGSARVSPRDLTAKLLEDHLRVPGAEDLLAMKVEVRGRKDGADMGHRFTLLDFFDRESSTTAMARTTAFTASVVAQLVARKEITATGVLTPEEIGMRKGVYDMVIKELKDRNVVVSGGPS
jgi:lysine 6-dehydrogenase